MGDKVHAVVGMRCVLHLTAFLLLSSAVGENASAQQFAFGVKGGVWTTGDIGNPSSFADGILHLESKRYIIGPMVELRLPLRLSVEFDVLYRRLGFTQDVDYCCGFSVSRERDNSWEFPITVKYRLSERLFQPFVAGGFAPRIVHGSSVGYGCQITGINIGDYACELNVHSNASYPVTHGVVVAGGLNIDAHHLRFTPEVRYVHWNEPYYRTFQNNSIPGFSSQQNEFFVLLGIAWH